MYLGTEKVVRVYLQNFKIKDYVISDSLEAFTFYDPDKPDYNEFRFHYWREKGELYILSELGLFMFRFKNKNSLLKFGREGKYEYDYHVKKDKNSEWSSKWAKLLWNSFCDFKEETTDKPYHDFIKILRAPRNNQKFETRMSWSEFLNNNDNMTERFFSERDSFPYAIGIPHKFTAELVNVGIKRLYQKVTQGG